MPLRGALAGAAVAVAQTTAGHALVGAALGALVRSER
jgi:hypothetical protein